MPSPKKEPLKLAVAAIAAVGVFVLWLGVEVAAAVSRLSEGRQVYPVADKLDALAAGLAEELSRQELASEFAAGEKPTLERIDALIAVWDKLGGGVAAGVAGPEAESGLRRAADYMAAVAGGRIRLAEPMAGEMRLLLQGQVRADAEKALIEVRLAQSHLRNPRREELEAEQRSRLLTLGISLSFGLSVLAVMVYRFLRPEPAQPPARGTAVDREKRRPEPSRAAPPPKPDPAPPDVIRNAPLPLMVLDRDGRIRQASKAFEDLTGFAAGEVGGQPYWERLLAEESVETARAEFTQGRVAGEAVQVWRGRRDETVRLRWTRRVVTDEAGGIREVIAIGVVDKPAAAQPWSRPRKLAENVARSFSHHLTAINGYSDLVLQSLGSRDANRDDVEEIRRAGERAAALAGQLQYFSAPEASLTRRRVDVNTFALGLDRRLRALLHSNVMLGFKTDENTGEVEGDEAQLEQAVVSLVLNAQDAMAQGGKLTIETGPAWSEERGWWSTIAVIDTGRGVDPSAREHLFEPFFSTKATGRGTGLGLAVVNDIARRHGGAMDVVSEPGQGSTFRIYLPRADESRFPPPKRATERVESAG